MALGSFLREGKTRRVQQSLVGPSPQISRRRSTRRTLRLRLRSRRKISRPRQHSVRALFPGAHLSISISACPLQNRRLPGPASPLLHLLQQSRRRSPQRNALPRCKQTLARSPRRPHWRKPARRLRLSRLLRPPKILARRAKQTKQLPHGLVMECGGPACDFSLNKTFPATRLATPCCRSQTRPVYPTFLLHIHV